MPEYELGGVLDAILKHISGSRAKFGVGVRILVNKMDDVKSAFRQVGMNPDGASPLACRLGLFLFVDVHL